MNTVNLIGRISQDPKLTYTKDNLAIFSTSIAVPKGKDKAIFIGLKAFDKRAENMNKFFSKGMQLGVTGRLDVEEWTTPEGKKTSKVVVIVDDFTFADKKKETETENETAPIPKTYEGTGFYTMADDGEELPF